MNEDDTTDKQKLISILNALKLPASQWLLSGEAVRVLAGSETEKLEEVDIFVTTALWFAMYESTSLTWGLSLPDPENEERKNDPPSLFVKFVGIQVNVFHAWPRRMINIDVNFWMRNAETISGFPCIPVRFHYSPGKGESWVQ